MNHTRWPDPGGGFAGAFRIRTAYSGGRSYRHGALGHPALTQATTIPTRKERNAMTDRQQTSPILEAFSASLRRWREREGITMAVAAARFEVTTATVCLWEHGIRFPSAEHLATIARETRIPACCLVHGPEGRCPIVRQTHRRKGHASACSVK